MDVTIAVSTYGDQRWGALATERAMPSAAGQAPVIWVHGESLHDARNEALEQVRTEWVINLDADDELAPGYVEAMAAGSADMRAPAVCYIRDGLERQAYVPKVAGHHHDCAAECLLDGNWLVIGTALRVDLLREAGGWREWRCYEDWDAFQRCWQLGASIEARPGAIYRAHVRTNSRNRSPAMAEKNEVHRAIMEANFPNVVAA